MGARFRYYCGMDGETLASLRAAWGATIPERILGHFFANMARLVGSGIVVSEAAIVASKGLDKEMYAIAEAIAPRLQNGMPLYQSLVPYRLRLPEMTIPVLEVGEVSGTLDDACARLAGAFQKMDGFDKRYEDVAVEPKKFILAGAMFSMLFAVGNDLWHVFLAAIGTAVQLTVLYIVFRILLANRYRWPKLHVLMDQIHLAIPHVGAIERNLATARWGRSFATMWHAGVPVSQALDVASRSTLNAYYEKQMRHAVFLTRQGVGVSEAMSHIELVPKDLLPLLAVGEETADFGPALDRFVEALEEEALVKAQQETTGAVVMIYLIAGFIVLMIALGVRLTLG